MTSIRQAGESPAAPSRLPPFLRARFGDLPRSFWVLWAGSLVNRIGTMVEPFLAFYLNGVRGLSIIATGLVMAVFAVGSIISQFVGGVLADRIGRRATLTGGMLANAVAMVILGYVTAIPAVVVTVLFLGITIDMYRPASAALVADLVPSAERPRAFGLLFWAVNLGFAVAMVAGGMLARSGFIWLFWADAITCAIFGLLVWRAIPETRIRKPAHEREPGGFGTVLKDKVMLAVVLITLLYMFVYYQAYTTMPMSMHAQGLPPSAYGFAMALNGLVIVVIQPLVVNWLGRHDRSRVIACGMITVGCGFGLITFASTALEYAATVLVWTLGEIVFAAVAGSVVVDLAPPHLRGRYDGLWGIAWSTGALLAPLGGTRLLAIGRPVLWLGCLGLTVAGAAGQLLLGPAIRRRTPTPFSDSDVVQKPEVATS
ncbi:MAG: MDR family MFS transporter [Actinoallomurus sp.]